MPYYVGLDASKETTQICVIDTQGKVVEEGAVPTEPKAVVAFLRGHHRRYSAVGMEHWSVSPWLYDGLRKAGLPVVTIGAREAHAFLKTQRNKTDRHDARGIAQLMRIKAYIRVHVRSPESRQVRTGFAVRANLLLLKGALTNAVHGTLLQAGVKLATRRPLTFEARVRAALTGHKELAAAVLPLLRVRKSISTELAHIDRAITTKARADTVCQRLMTAPGVGPLTALAFKAYVDDPSRFASSRALGASLGMTPKTFESGEVSRRGRISRWGDRSVRTALFLAALSSFKRNTRPSSLKAWGARVAERRGRGRAVLAVARKLAVILHRMWVTETDFQQQGPLASATS